MGMNAFVRGDLHDAAGQFLGDRQRELRAVLDHAQQAFLLHPPAKAHFSYPCPFGDCTGIYHLQDAIGTMLKGAVTNGSGSLVCTGLRARGGVPGQPCGQAMNYTVAVQYAQPAAPVTRRASGAAASR
jgi:hypothetical protein